MKVWFVYLFIYYKHQTQGAQEPICW